MRQSEQALDNVILQARQSAVARGGARKGEGAVSAIEMEVLPWTVREL